MHSIDDLISTTEAIKMLGVDRSTLSRYVKFGDIQPAKRFGDGPKAFMLFWRADIETLRESKVAAGVIRV
jgi:predicted site-specific integrase-resolvase